MKTIYEKGGVRIAATGKDYDFLATVENDNDEAVCVEFTGECADLESFVVYPHDWVGITGWNTLTAFENGCFRIYPTNET